MCALYEISDKIQMYRMLICSLTAALQQIRGTSGIRFFAGASDWDGFCQIGKKVYFAWGSGPIVGPVGIIKKCLLFLGL